MSQASYDAAKKAADDSLKAAKAADKPKIKK